MTPACPIAVNFGAREIPVQKLPYEALRYLYSSRYCEVDRFSTIAVELFGPWPRGWSRVQAVCDWVHSQSHLRVSVRPAHEDGVGGFRGTHRRVPRFSASGVTLCRALNIPARYATGYLGDIGVPPAPSPMDFSAWFEVYLEDRWWTFDARHNHPRIGRVLMATGRDASDVAITTSFGMANLTQFTVISEELPPEQARAGQNAAG